LPRVARDEGTVLNRFAYRRVDSVGQAVALMKDNPEAKLLAGGQSLLASMRLGLSAPTLLIDLQSIAQMTGIRDEANGQLWVGAMVTHAEIARSSVVRRFCPMLADLAHGIADQQVRNRGTLGGAISNNDPAACWPAGLLALGATVITNQRELSADEFFSGMFSTALEPFEVVCAVRFPRPTKAAYLKFEQPASRFAIVGVAVAQMGVRTRVAVTGLGMGVVRFDEAERCLSGDFQTSVLAECAIDSEHAMGDLHASAQYRAHLASVLCRRAVTKALMA
jgi:aerobic carbon-monoxide dehydrogenase medium subunit